MKKKLAIGISALLMLGLVACGADGDASGQSQAASGAGSAATGAETLTGQGEGFGGVIEATVTRENGVITKVEVVGANETNGIGTPALDELPAKIVDANGTNVDVIAGATVTSNGIIYAVNNALDPTAYPYPPAGSGDDSSTTPGAVTAASVYQGFGLDSSGRIGPGTDDQDVQVYSVNQVLANALFDDEGRILALYVDQIEYATPNYDGETMPQFSGFPGQGGYNYDEDHDEVVDGKTEDTDENFLTEVSGWVTKRDRGASYVMGAGTWAAQMDHFQNTFIGMTVDEVEEWFAKYCSDVNGRPLKEVTDDTKEEDKAKYEALSDDEKTMLADVVAGATMSLNDSHGNIIAAIRAAYDNRVPLDITSAAGIGLGVNNSGRIGPGTDDQDVQVYSVNQVFANTVFDADGRIVAIYVDQLEFATPNYDGDGMPHFTGFPGQEAYNADTDHDEVVDTQITPTEETFVDDIAGWATKRDRGDSYRMGAGTWAAQMDTFQKIFIGMTTDEVEEWFAKYCSDVNGRPLKEVTEDTKEEDKAKYEALTDDEKAMLADVVASATMSLNDSHGNIIAAIYDSVTTKATIDLTVG